VTDGNWTLYAPLGLRVYCLLTTRDIWITVTGRLAFLYTGEDQ